MKTDIRSYLAADSAARRLKINTETGKSSVHTDNQQDPPLQKDLADILGTQRHQTVLKKRHSETLAADSETNQLKLTIELSLDRHQQNSH